MPVGITGDFKKLKRWEDKLKRSPELARKVNANLAEETISLVQEGMARGVDPYGKPYAPLVIRKGQPLRKTGQMKSSWNRKVGKGGFEVRNAKSYSIFHQEGTGIYGFKKRRIVPRRKKALRIPAGGGAIYAKSVAGTPKRRMLPDRGLPKRWRRAYIETINEVFISHFR